MPSETRMPSETGKGSGDICSRHFQRILTSFRRHLEKPNPYPLQFEPEGSSGGAEKASGIKVDY
ncbi:TPA: hypothetical protein ACFRG8_001736 [Neisseria lactamica]